MFKAGDRVRVRWPYPDFLGVTEIVLQVHPSAFFGGNIQRWPSQFWRKEAALIEHCKRPVLAIWR